jgi:hypothetical protein
MWRRKSITSALHFLSKVKISNEQVFRAHRNRTFYSGARLCRNLLLTHPKGSNYAAFRRNSGI